MVCFYQSPPAGTLAHRRLHEFNVVFWEIFSVRTLNLLDLPHAHLLAVSNVESVGINVIYRKDSTLYLPVSNVPCLYICSEGLSTALTHWGPVADILNLCNCSSSFPI